MHGLAITLTLALLVVLAAAPVTAAEAPPAVDESARDIPVAYDVDVVVVGGSGGAAAAAIAAAKAGASVFLAAPRSYVGDDMCATMRLWLEPGEKVDSPLARALYEDAGPAPVVADPTALPFTYKASLRAAAKHPDATPPRLTDGKFGNASADSVQYDGDVDITCDLGKPEDIREVRVVAYDRPGDFGVGKVQVQLSQDGKAWKDAQALSPKRSAPKTTATGNPGEESQDLRIAVGAKARYVRLVLVRPEGATRILVGEVMICAPEAVPAAAPVAAAAPDELPRGPVRPMHVKKTLDDALLAAGVQYLVCCYTTDLVVDAAGKPAGVVIANRNGRQAVLAKVVIDATPTAAIARLTGAAFARWPAGPHAFQRVVVGGEPVEAEGVTARKTGLKFTSGRGSYELIEYTLRLDGGDGSFGALQAAEQKARDLTWHKATADSSEALFFVPPDPMKGQASAAGAWPGAAGADLKALRPAGVERMLVLGGCADVSREAAAAMLRPAELVALGERVGAAAAAEAKAAPVPQGVRVAGAKGPAAAAGDVKELLGGLRPVDKPKRTIPSPARSLPVLGTYDVVVVGGGTGGAPAGIGAGRQGAKTLLIEILHDLGGVGTLGMITQYYHGYRGGFTAEADAGVKELGAAVYAVGKAEYWRQENRKAKTDIWFGSLGCGALVEGNVVKGVVVATPMGRGVVLAKAVVDATGNADIAAAAGAKTDYVTGEHVGIQGVGLPPIGLGANYTNTDYTFADDTDPVDFWHLFVAAREKFKGAYDLGQLVDTRERRRIVGDVTLSPMDMVLNRVWPDTISQHKSNFDSHGFTVHPLFLLKPPDRESMTVYVPYRALVPQGIEGVLVTGLGVSAHRDAIPVIRMQPCVQNQGYAAGAAASMAASSACDVRNIDLRGLQRSLVKDNLLPEHVLEDKDSFPLPKERVAKAVASVPKDHPDLAVILSHKETALPMLREAYAKAADAQTRLVYAHILGIMGDATGAEALAAQVKAATEWDKGWNYVGMGQFGMSISPLDSYIIALGRTKDARALPTLLEKAATLDASVQFSHHRACAMALEALGDKRAAPVLAAVLAKPGMTGYATTTIDEAKAQIEPSGTATKMRNDSLRELVLARALYRCGDQGGLGRKILERYAKDLRGIYARHATAVLEGEGRRD